MEINLTNSLLVEIRNSFTHQGQGKVAYFNLKQRNYVKNSTVAMELRALFLLLEGEEVRDEEKRKRESSSQRFKSPFCWSVVESVTKPAS